MSGNTPEAYPGDEHLPQEPSAEILTQEAARLAFEALSQRYLARRGSAIDEIKARNATQPSEPVSAHRTTVWCADQLRKF